MLALLMCLDKQKIIITKNIDTVKMKLGQTQWYAFIDCLEYYFVYKYGDNFIITAAVRVLNKKNKVAARIS